MRGIVAVAGLPGVATPGRPPGVRPWRLLDTGSLLLRDVRPGHMIGHDRHLAQWGPNPMLALDGLLGAAVGLVGAGGAGFPTDRKLASLAGSKVWAVVVNGAEGESASGKDGALLCHVPHLALDGAALAADALGAQRIIVRISADRPDVRAALDRAIAERPDAGISVSTGAGISVSIGPAEFAAGEASAVINALRGGDARPVDLGRPPSVRVGLTRRRQTVMLSNVETFSRLALAARGLPTASALVSLSGAVAQPGVVELPCDLTLTDALKPAGGLVGAPAVLVTGGWHGKWLPWDEPTARVRLTREALADAGGRWGAGALIWIPEDLTPIDALAAIAMDLARGSAGQCGPCAMGLPELARLLQAGAPRGRIDQLIADIDGRGICAHPSAAVSAIRSALDLIASGRIAGMS